MSRPTPGSGARRSSYASVLSGNTLPPSGTTPRSGFLSQLNDPASATSQLPQSFPPQQPQAHAASSASINESRNLQLDDTFPPSGSLSSMLGAFPAETQSADFFVPSYLRGSRHLQRLQERYKARVQAQKDGRSARSSVTGSLSTSTSGVNLHKMVPSHRGMTHEIIERPFKQGKEETPPAELPSRWSSTDKASGIEVASDGSEAKFNGTTKTTDEGAAARADRPVPKECGVYYFEIDVLSKNKESQIAVGLSGSQVVLTRMPGWEPLSWAYHSDDGNCFSQSANGKSYGPKFASTDVVGCGVNFRTNSVFFTKNGVRLGTAFCDIKDEPLFPTIGFKRANEQVRANFGQSPFVYDIDGLVEMERENLRREIDKEDVSELHKGRQEPQLLQELVMQYLAHDGYIETAKAFASEVREMSQFTGGAEGHTSALEFEEDQDAVNRQRIRSAILDGDMDRALKLTNTFYPSVLAENENIYFKLRCRKFIEMIRRCTELRPSPKNKSRNGSKGATANGHGTTIEDTGVFDGQMELDDEVAIVDDGMDIEQDADSLAKQAGLMSDALAYGQELQSEFKDDPRREVKQALEDTFALIAYPDARESSLAPLLEADGRVPVAEELNSAILVSLGKSSNSVIERLYQQTEALIHGLSKKGDGAALLNPRGLYLS